MIDILMPRLSDTMTEGTIASWHKKPGDTVAVGDILVEIETDKAVMDQEAYESGVLGEILVAEGDHAAIGTPIARLDDGRESAPATVETADPTPTGTEAVTASAPAPDGRAPAPDGQAPAATVSPGAPASGRPELLAATPLVRRLAKDRGINLAEVAGTGPGGRIVRADLDAHKRPAPISVTGTPTLPPADDIRGPEVVPFDGIRRAIASRLTESATTIPTFTATASADVEALLEMRVRVNESMAQTGDKVSVNDLLVRATALALRAHPGVNASYSPDGEGRTLVHSRVHVGIAVASPAGLVVPVVKDADRAAVSTISTAATTLVGKAAERKLSAEDMTGGTFTISNLGMFGVEHFTAIINPPQGAILAIGATTPEVRIVDGRPTEYRRLRYTITADHRIIDGALAAQFLATLTTLLEDPYRILL